MARYTLSVYLPPREMRRVDGFLGSLWPDWSRTFFANLVEEGHVTINGKVAKKGDRIKTGDVIEAEVTPQKTDILAQDIPLEIVFENSDFAIINKDPGMNVHSVPGAGGNENTLINALLHHFGGLSVIGGIERPGLVHRLDKDTSGLITIAKSDRAMQAIQRAFEARTVKKSYLALVVWNVQDERGLIESYLGRDPNDRKKITAIDPINPKFSKTGFTRLLTIENGAYTLLLVRLFTGRTHQIRVHLSSIGHPIVGDVTYGNPRANRDIEERFGLARQWLHAWQLEFAFMGKHYAFEAPLKEDIAKTLPKNWRENVKNILEKPE